MTLLGIDVDGQQVAFDLVPDASTRIITGDQVWVRYWGMVDRGPVGFAQLYVQEVVARKVYLTGPTVISMSQTRLTPERIAGRTDERPCPNSLFAGPFDHVATDQTGGPRHQHQGVFVKVH